MIGKIFYIGKNLSKARHWRTSSVFSKYSLGSWGVATLGKCNFWSHLSLETVFAALKLKRNYYAIMHISFS